MDGYKHFALTQLINGEQVVIDVWTSGFPESAKEGAVCILEDGPRSFYQQWGNIFDQQRRYRFKLIDGQMVERTQAELDAEINTVAKRRQDVLNKWDPQIDAQRETLRKLQDEDKPAAAITKAKTNIHNLVASKNTELAGVV